jgi:hypothetical protein
LHLPFASALAWQGSPVLLACAPHLILFFITSSFDSVLVYLGSEEVHQLQGYTKLGCVQLHEKRCIQTQEQMQALSCFGKLGCFRFQRHFVKVLNETGGCLWIREGNSAGNSSSRR